MSTTPVPHPPQLTLAGQAHTAEGPLDMSGMYVMHHAFRRDLDRFAAAVAGTPLDEAATWRALSARWERFSSMLHHHHAIEDATLWPPLLDRVDAAGVPGGRETLIAMQAEHATIDPQLAACADAFTGMATAPTDAARDRLRDCLDRTRQGLDRHLAHEETDALPLVQEHLPPEAWAASERAAQRSFAPREMAFLVPWAAEGLDREARDRAFGTAGWTFRAVYGLTRRRFHRREAVPFRHAPAAR